MRQFFHRRVRAGIAIVIVIAVFFFAANADSIRETSDDGFVGDTQQKMAFWQSSIRTLGPEGAARDFNARVQKVVSQDSWHINAHIFGAALYEEKGYEALGYCLEGFTFGCFHEAFKRLVAEKNDKNIAAAIQKCEENSGSWHPCHHALGHGLVSYFGHTKDGLLSALKECDKYPEDPLNGCVGGAFMEYNLYTSRGVALDAREPDATDIYAPCRDVRETNVQACYLWLAQWGSAYFSSVKGDSPEEVARKVGQLCEASPRSEFARDCMERLGQQLSAHAKGDPEKTRALCSLVSKDKSLVMSCVSYAAWVTQYIDESKRDDAVAMCDDLSGEEKKYCLMYASGKAWKAAGRSLPGE